jgi:CBS domain-containing protein
MGVDDRDDLVDDDYLKPPRQRSSVGFDSQLLRESLNALPARRPVVFTATDTVTEAMRAMQNEHRGCVVVTDDGTVNSKLKGIFTERDVLFRVVDQGKNPAKLSLGEVMTADPEVLGEKSTVAYVLDKMSLGGFRHIPVVDEEHRPLFVISVRDVVKFLTEAFPREALGLPAEQAAGSQRTREGS